MVTKIDFLWIQFQIMLHIMSNSWNKWMVSKTQNLQEKCHEYSYLIKYSKHFLVFVHLLGNSHLSRMISILLYLMHFFSCKKSNLTRKHLFPRKTTTNGLFNLYLLNFYLYILTKFLNNFNFFITTRQYNSWGPWLANRLLASKWYKMQPGRLPKIK